MSDQHECGLCETLVGPEDAWCEKHRRERMDEIRINYKQTARDIIERMKTIRPTCEKCESRCYSEGVLDKPLAEGLLATGWEHDTQRAGWNRRCAACANGRRYPWADRLDVDLVANMLEYDARCQVAFELSILEDTLKTHTCNELP